ncbi:MAG: hypothetical protein M1820_010366 [Bogoriella megaspora]|nr:MAG: hypothetical protein M1820_010366 [Bogoriella megaspora]
MGKYPEDLDGSSDSSYGSYGSGYGYSYSNNPSDIDRRAIARYTPSENLDMLRGLVEQLVPNQEAVDWISDYIDVLEDQLGTQDTIIRYFKSLASPTAVATPSLPRSMPPSIESEASAESESTATKLCKLTPKQKVKLAGEDRCFRCRGKGHYSYQECCPNNQWKRRKAIPASATSDIPAVPAPAPPPIVAPPVAIPLPAPSAATSATPEVKPEPNTAIKSEPHASPPATAAAPGPDVKSEVKFEPPDSPEVKYERPDSPAVESEPSDSPAIPVYVIKNGTFEEAAATSAAIPAAATPATPATPPSHSARIAKWPEKSRLPLFLTKPWQMLAG